MVRLWFKNHLDAAFLLELIADQGAHGRVAFMAASAEGLH
jgi:hypothetical protein